MSQVGFQFEVTAGAESFFTEALAINGAAASAMYNVPMQVNLGAAGRRCLIRAIQVVAVENWGPEFSFFASKNGFTTDPDTDTFLGRFGFTSSMGSQLGGSGLWRYYNDSMAIPYYDLGTDSLAVQAVPTVVPQTLHVVAQNISTTINKSAGEAGETWVQFLLEPFGSY